MTGHIVPSTREMSPDWLGRESSALRYAALPDQGRRTSGRRGRARGPSSAGTGREESGVCQRYVPRHETARGLVPGESKKSYDTGASGLQAGDARLVDGRQRKPAAHLF